MQMWLVTVNKNFCPCGLCDGGVLMRCTNLKTMFPALLLDTLLIQRKRERQTDRGRDRERLQMERERTL
jgi:hypothetical protein